MNAYFSSTFYTGFTLQGRDAEASEQARRDAALDEALSCTFPASDPIALNFDFVPLSQPDRERPGGEFRHVRPVFAGRK